jgi:hypothetical protein
MLVFWCLLLVGGVNFVVMSSYEMPSYEDVCDFFSMLKSCWKDLPEYQISNYLFPIVILL